MAQSLDGFLPQLATQDTKKKVQIGNDILNYLSIEDNSLECENISAFIDSIIHWLNNSNFKVAQNGLEILAHLAVRMKDDLKPYLSSVLSPTIDRLGDSKDCVREQAKAFLMKLMNFVSTPQIILEKLIPAFSHKNWRIREEMCFFLQECLLRYGVQGSTNGQLLVGKFVPSLVILLTDPNLQVRDTSMATIVELYKHVGKRLRDEILRKHSNMPQQKLQTLLAKFDAIAGTGEVITASNNCRIIPKSRVEVLSSNGVNYNDEVDFKKSNFNKRATSAPPIKRNVANINKYPVSSSSTKSSGAADEEMFMNSFEEVPRIQIFSTRDVEQELVRIRDICSNPSQEWEKRTECLRKLRSLLIAGATDYDEFYYFLKPLEVPFQTSVKDLRSQVVREACISIAYLSQRIGNRCDRFAEALLPTLINLIQNSAKIMSSSAVVAIRFIIQHTHASRLVPIITYNISSKSKEIRKACCEFLDQLLHTWPTQTLEKHVGVLQEAIKKGISDADPEARALARKAFWGFADKFKVESDYLLSSLDSSKQRMLQGEQMSNWSSTNSLNKASYSSRPQSSRTNSVSTNGSMESINRHFGMLKRSAIPISSPKTNSASPRTPVRATSAIDIDSQRRARAKASSYLNQPRPVMLNSVYSLTSSNTRAHPETTNTNERGSRKSRVSKSQPGSRSTSPSSRLSYYSNIPSSSGSKSKRRPSTSRDHSPSRTPITYERKLSTSSSASRSTRMYMMNSDLDLSNNRILQYNDEEKFEYAFLRHVTPRKKHYDDQSDESETSSICSDTSFVNYPVLKVEDISKILENLSSANWSERKDGLMSLATFFRQTDGKLNPFELKRITDIFTRMLVDPHTKAFALFLTVLNELIQMYKHELSSWLYILMTRLFLKFGSDTLGSVQTRIQKTLELIRESFPIDQQFDVIMRLISDQTQTLNVKVKIAILDYLSKLLFLMDSSDFTYNRANNRDIQASLVKIISWTADIKSSDLRKISQDTIVDLYNLNSNEMTIYINELPKTYQDAAHQIIQHKRKTRHSQSPAPVMQTPYMVKNLYTSNKVFYDDSENLNPDEIYDSLKKTSDEIQKYSFSLDTDSLTPAKVNNSYNNNSYSSNSIQKSSYSQKIDALSSASLDSGISQIDGFRNLNLNNHDGVVGNHLNSPLKPVSLSRPSDFNHVFSSSTSNSVSTNGHTTDTFLNSFNSNTPIDTETYQHHLNELFHYVRDCSVEEVTVKCKPVYKALLTRLATESNNQTKIRILRAMSSILGKGSFGEFLETTLIRLLEFCKDTDKDVVKASEETAAIALSHFDTSKCFKVLQPYINHSDGSLIIVSIRLITKMAELKKEDIKALLPELMPPLLQAYDNKESAVRKATVFCMVAIYGAVGDQMNIYLQSLNTSKMKLLKLYIDRSVQINNKS